MEKKTLKPRCWNCKYGGPTFKITGKTHLFCENREKYPKSDFDSGKVDPLDSLNEGFYTCELHEFKASNSPTI